jgi:3-phenylpropionate/trans-cinnamate dioxygenase ferredoxin reductase component
VGSDRIVIVGGGPAGLSAARGYRAAGGRAPVVILAAEPHPPYRRPPLTKEFLRGRIPPEELPIEDDAWFRRHDVELRTATPAAAVRPGDREVDLEDGGTLAYGECVLCTGSEPVRPPLDGADLPGVHVIRTRDDSAAIGAAVRAGVRVAVIGSGFVGCEAAASLAMRGAGVTVVTPEPAPQAERLGGHVGRLIRAWLEEAGAEVRCDVAVSAIRPEGAALHVVLEGGDEVPCDRVVLGTGVRPRVALAEAAGLTVEDGAVPVDAAMRSSADGVRCAGDIALAHNPTAGRRLRVEHWGEALAQGEVAGRAIAGEDARWDAVPGFWSTIGLRTLKQHAWGDGWDDVHLDAGADGFTAWYGRDGRLVGVLTHERDRDYERGNDLIAAGAPFPPPA